MSDGPDFTLARANASPVREAKLKPEFAHLYPNVEPGVWLIAATVAEYLLSRIAIQGGPDPQIEVRVLNDEHFEFRGDGAGVGRVGKRTRATDV